MPEAPFSGTDQTLVAGPGSKMRLNAGPRIEDAAIVEVVPVAAAMDLLA